MLRILGRISFALILTLAVCGSLAVGALATVIEVLAPPNYEIVWDDLPEVSATSWIVFDAQSGEVLAAHGSEIPLPIASVTKLPAAATLYADHREELFATTTITWSDVYEEGRAGRLSAGDEYTPYTLLFPLLLESSNDAAVALVRVVATLVPDMNAYAEQLSLTSTTFADASGLSESNISTAADLAVIARDIFETKRHVIDITALDSHLVAQNGWLNNSPFIGMNGYLGGKHGYTPTANHTAIAFFAEQFEADTRPVGYILLQSGNLPGDVEVLRTYVAEQVSYR